MLILALPGKLEMSSEDEADSWESTTHPLDRPTTSGHSEQTKTGACLTCKAFQMEYRMQLLCRNAKLL